MTIIIKGKKERLVLSGNRTYDSTTVIKNLRYSHRHKMFKQIKLEFRLKSSFCH